MRSVRDRIITAICDEALRNPGVTVHFGDKAMDGRATILGWTFNAATLADAIIAAIETETPRTVAPVVEKWAELEARISTLEQTAPRVVPCKACNGTGESSAYAKTYRGVEVCPGCNGRGVQRV